MKKGWPTKRLGDLFAFKNGRAFKKEEWTTKGLPISRIQNLNNEDASFNYFAGEYSQDILVEPGDLLFSWSGTVGSSFGSHLWTGEPGVLNQHIFKIGLRETIAKRYAFHGLRYITAEIEQSVNGAVGLVHITKERLNEFTLPIPPLAEQQRIVGLLDEAFEGIATAKGNTEKNLQNARALFESHLQSVFTQRGPGWVETTIGEACVLKSGTTVSPMLEKPIGDVPYLKVADMTFVGNADKITTSSRFLCDEDVRESSIIPKGSTIFPKRGGAILTNKKRITSVSICADLNIMAVIPSSQIDSELLYLYFINVDMRKLGTGSTIPQINNYDVAPLLISFPAAISEQRKIVAELGELRKETQRLARLYERKLAALEALKKSLLHQAFSGEL